MSEPHSHHGAVALVTIVAEAVVEGRLLRDLRAAGAHGWTITAARGEGPRNRRVGDLDGGNVRIEALVSHATADAIMAILRERWFPDYAVVAWVADVEVAREDRYL